MARSTALRIRMDMALKADAGDLTAFAEAVQKVEALKTAALDAGFVFTEEVTSRVGSFEFADDNPPEAPQEEPSADAVIPGAESE